jgi:hypothetical protein
LPMTIQSSVSKPSIRVGLIQSSGKVRTARMPPHTSLGGFGYVVRPKPAIVATKWTPNTTNPNSTFAHLDIVVPFYWTFTPPCFETRSLK